MVWTRFWSLYVWSADSFSMLQNSEGSREKEVWEREAV